MLFYQFGLYSNMFNAHLYSLNLHDSAYLIMSSFQTWKNRQKSPTNERLFNELVDAFTKADIPNIGQKLFSIWKNKYKVI